MAYPQQRRSSAGNEFGLEPAAAIQDVISSSQVTPNGNLFPLIASAGHVTLSGVPTIITSDDGHAVTLMNVDSLKVITLVDDTLGNTKLKLSTPTLRLFPGESARFTYSSSVGLWLLQLGRTDAIHRYDPLLPPATANAMDDEFDDSNGSSGPMSGLNAKWTGRNLGASAITFPKQSWVHYANGGAGGNFRIYTQARPSAQDYTIEMLFGLEGTYGSQYGGMCLDNGTAFYMFGMWPEGTGTNSARLVCFRFTNVTTNANADPIGIRMGWGNYAYLRAVWTNATTTFTLWASLDGVSWIRCGSFSDAITHTAIGFCTEGDANTVNAINLDYFRRTA